MSVTMYLLYDGELKYAMMDDPSQFTTVTETSVFGCNVGDQINWQVSSHDTQLESIKIQNKNKINGKTPVKGGWKNAWTEKPKKISNTQYQGTPNAAGATAEDPQLFAFDITYKVKGESGQVTIDPIAWYPNPPADPPVE